MSAWGSVLEGSRPAVMGIVNVTPDSFSDGGRWLDHADAVRHGLDLVAAGADVLDVGGESTRPGASPVEAAEERRRVVPVVATLAAEAGVPVSVDTTKAPVAAAALEAGATVVNDVSAGRADPDMLATVAGSGAGYVAMHMLGEPRTMQDDPRYDDVVREVGDFLVERLDACRAAGIAGELLVADPGIGFGKTVRHNLELLAGLPRLAARVGAPLLVGTSRKSFLGRLLGGAPATSGRPRSGELRPSELRSTPVDERDEATLATVTWAFDRGARMVRVHDARGAARAAELLVVLRAATSEGVAA
jgi:dihydropteroate synthase